MRSKIGKFHCRIYLLSLVLLLAMQTWAQAPRRVNLQAQKQSLIEVLQQIKQETGVRFIYSDNELNNASPVTIRLKDTPLEDALKQIFKNQPYVVENNAKDIYTIVPITSSTSAKQGKKIIRGKVVDGKNGEALIGATIMENKYKTGTISAADGTFVMEVSKDCKQINVSYIGYTPQDVILTDKRVYVVTLNESSQTLDAVVVTGIFTRKKESFTGSAATFNRDELKQTGTSNVLQSLKSLDPSFAIIDDTQFGSNPNRLPNMEIRGKSSMLGMRDELETDPNQPLFILDGFESSLAAINDLDINRIESITILKDAASTAIYGSKAANGVVVVETVKPKAGELQVSYNGNINISSPELSSYNMMNAAEKIEFERLAGRYDASLVETPNLTETDIKYSQMYYDRLRTIAEGVDTDWLAEPLRVGVNHKHSLYVSGGEGNFMFGIGGAYNGISGVMKGSDRKIYSGNIDLIYRKAQFQFSNKFSVSYADYSNPTVNFSEYVSANPYYKKYNNDGSIPQWLEYNDDIQMANPVWNASLNSRNAGDNLTLSNYFITEWTPNSQWKVRGKFGITYTSNDTEIFTSPENTNQVLAKEAMKRGEYTATNTKGLSYEGDLSATYAHLIGDHRINLVAGGNIYSTNSLLSGFTAEGFPAGDFTYPSFSNGYPEGSVPVYYDNTTRSVNAYLNLGYSYLDKYLLDVSLRENGSSVFGSSKRFNTTWSVGLGWNIHRENFVVEKLPFINYFKIRASIGNPGNQSFDSGSTLITYALQSGMLNYFGLGALPNQIGNPNLEWQITQDKNIGLDLTLFNNRFSLTLDYFHKVTDPLLIGITMPYSSGTTEYFTNAGEQTSQGLTFTALYHIFRDIDRRLLWSVRVNGRTQKNEINKIGDKLDAFNNNGKGSHTLRYFDGADPDDIWVIRSAGIDPSTGKELFYTKDGKYTYDFSYDNEVVCGNTRPDWEGILGTSFTYKGFSLNLNFRYRLGGDVFNTALMNKVENVNYYYNQDRRALYERWKNPGDITSFKNIRDVNQAYTPMTSRFIQTENSLTLESVHLQYEFMDGWIKRFGLGNLKIFASMRDAFYLSSIRAERGTDYPYAKTIEAGLSLNF